MNNWDWPLVVSLLNLITLGFILPMYHHISKIRHNEMRHIWKALDRIEATLIRHVERHEKI